jgi:hypothetical protein
VADPVRSKSGDGASCWTGSKIKCVFDEKKWKETAAYQEQKFNNDKAANLNPQFTWFGKAPFCGADDCDAYKAGMIPIKHDNCGDGSCCFMGEKVLARKPTSDEDKKRLDLGMSECYKLRLEQEKTLQQGLSLGTEAAKTIGSIITKA